MLQPTELPDRAGNGILNTTPTAQTTKEKVNILDFIKKKNLLCIDHYQKNKKWEKILKISEKSLVPRMDKEFSIIER